MKKATDETFHPPPLLKFCYEKVALLDNFFQLVERTADFVV